MTQFLDIHVASDEERCRAHENCHDVWSLGLPLADHVSRRESSALHRRARWIVGCLGGQVVAALASHPLHVRLQGRSLPGIGIASVHTLRSHRGQGIAQRMVRWAESFEQLEGARFSALFCDIEPRYYARLGYILCPAHQGTAVAVAQDRDLGYRLAVVGANESYSRRIPRLAAIYDSDHGRRALAIERTVEYWEHLGERKPTAENFWLVSPTGSECGYICARTAERGLVIEDHAVQNGEVALRETLLRLVIDLAHARGLSQVCGWLPAESPARELFTLTPRATEITMVKSLDMAITLDDEAIAATDWWQEIDHV